MHIPPFLIARRKQFIIAVAVIIFVLLFKSCGSEMGTETTEEALPSATVIDIEPGLQREMSATGEVETEKSANFIAEFKATVQDIAVKIGDTVTEGQSLVTLRAFEVEQKFNTANAYYISKGQTYQQTKIQSQHNVSEAQIALKTAQINLEKLQKENAAKTIQAEQTLKSAQLNLELSEASAQTALENAMRKTQTTVHDALTRADEILEFSPEQTGLAYEKETHIGVRDPIQKLKVRDAMIDAYNAYQSLQMRYTDTLSLLQATENALSMLLITLHNSVTSTEYTVDNLNTDISDITKNLSNVRTIISELSTAKAALDSAMQTTGGRSQIIIDAEAAYALTLAQLEASLRSAELDVERAKGALETAIASAKSNEISAYSNITTAKGDLEQARISQDELNIVAPFDGVVTDIPVRLGREVQQGEVILTMENADWLKITTYVSADEVRQIQIRDRVMVNGQQKATVASVAPSADPATKKFKVELRMDGDADLQVGSFVRLTFSLHSDQSQQDMRIFLPVTAVHVSAAETFVWTAREVEDEESTTESGTTIFSAHKQQVTIGDLSGKYIEIIEGVQQGDRVITEGGRALNTEGQNILLLP